MVLHRLVAAHRFAELVALPHVLHRRIEQPPSHPHALSCGAERGSVGRQCGIGPGERRGRGGIEVDASESPGPVDRLLGGDGDRLGRHGHEGAVTFRDDQIRGLGRQHERSPRGQRERARRLTGDGGGEEMLGPALGQGRHGDGDMFD